MENKTKLTAGVILTLVLAMSGTYFVAQDDDAYFCESKNAVMICDKLSSGIGTRCYFDNTYKMCKEGWTKVEVGQEIAPEQPEDINIPIHTQTSKKYLCSSLECVAIE